MKTLVFFCVLCSSIMGYAQKISFDVLLYDFGVIYDNQGKLSAIYTFTNTGNKPLIVEEVKASCGCTTSDYTKDPVLPGAQGTVHVKFNPQGFKGLVAKQIRVRSNSEDSGEVVLTVKAQVRVRDMALEQEYPYELEFIRLNTININFDKVYYPTIVSDTINIFNTQDTAITLNFPSLPDYYRVEVYPQATLQPLSKGSMVVFLDTKKRNEWGYIYDRIYVGYEGQKPSYKTRLNINAQIEEDFSNLTKKALKKSPVMQFEITDFVFDTIADGAVITCSFPFTNTGKSTLMIRKINTTCGCTAGKLEKREYAKGESGEIQVTFNTRGKRGNVMQRVTVITNNPKQPQYELYIKGVVLPSN